MHRVEYVKPARTNPINRYRAAGGMNVLQGLRRWIRSLMLVERLVEVAIRFHRDERAACAEVVP
jgi:hypothetical protein